MVAKLRAAGCDMRCGFTISSFGKDVLEARALPASDLPWPLLKPASADQANTGYQKLVKTTR